MLDLAGEGRLYWGQAKGTQDDDSRSPILCLAFYASRYFSGVYDDAKRAKPQRQRTSPPVAGSAGRPGSPDGVARGAGLASFDGRLADWRPAAPARSGAKPVEGSQP